jgi:hypothetical protein
MAKKFENLEKKMNPKRVKQAKARAREVMAEMLLAEIRKEAGFTNPVCQSWNHRKISKLALCNG